jgi:death-on-curing protein
MNLTYYWLTKQEAIALHDRAIEDFGGSLGVLNDGALESTLYRPQQLVHYEPESNICDLAAAYGHDLVKNHCFLDGNKRTAFVVMAVFLLRNSHELVASEVEAVDVMVDLAKGDISQAELAAWLSSNVSNGAEE